MVKQVRRWLPGRPIVIVADSAFCALDFLSATKSHATVITRLRLDAALYALAPQRLPVVPLRWVLIRDPLKQFESQALLCTDPEATPSFILQCFVQRWQVEVTFEEAREHLGVQTQRQWSDKAIARTTPCLLALYSIVTLAAQDTLSTGQLYRRCAVWYPKPQATFSDTIAGVRREL